MPFTSPTDLLQPVLARVQRVPGTQLIHLAVRLDDAGATAGGLVLDRQQARDIGRDLIRAAGARGPRALAQPGAVPGPPA
jgi:hypothetical protein